ncbi:MAG: succinate dehydrogenase assembly factor 2 [Gammaproteobacteria bacterium]|nr:succinate dehydrogenase assembly factor 2 [Gammaproteobacteria bacterium]
MVNESEMGRLRWQCRRGMKEVEIVLLPYLEGRYASAGGREQGLFRQLLACHDVDMFEWFTCRDKPAENDLIEIVEIVLGKVAT